MNNQQIYDKVCSQFALQGGPCYDSKGQPKLRYKSRSCPIGMLIPDGCYKRSLEDFSYAEQLFDKIKDYSDKEVDYNMYFLDDLMLFHDKSKDLGIGNVKSHLRVIALQWNLKTGAENRIKNWE